MKKLFAIGLLALCAACNKSNSSTGPSGSSSTTSASPAAGGAVTTIKLGHTSAYSGPASAYGIISKVDAAYFKMLDEKGGINGRQIELVDYDDAYNPAKTVELTRKLVEQDNILVHFHGIGTAPQTAVLDYLNQHKVPQIFIASGSDKFDDPKGHPWTVPFQPSYTTEARVFVKYIKESKPNARTCLLYQNDDFGKSFVTGLKLEFGAEHDKVVTKVISYEMTDPTVDSQVVTMQASGCDTAVIAATPKFAAQALRKISDIGWKPTLFVSSPGSSVSAVLKVVGLDKTVGVITGAYLKDANDPKLANDPAIVEFKDFLKKYVPEAEATDWNTLFGYTACLMMKKVLEMCGDDLSRENILKQALSLKDVRIPTLIEGILVNTSPQSPRPLNQLQLQRFNGASYELFGNIIKTD